MNKISAVLNSFNDERNIQKALQSVSWCDEIVVCDMYSEDKTAEIAKKTGSKVFYHKKQDYVELARNFAISKTSNEWILLLDPDEEIPESLKERLIEIASGMKHIDYVRIPRKNLIFNHFMKASMWWPDLNIRFFKKDKVKWGDKIHAQPRISGEGLDLPAEDKWAIVHYSYKDVSQFINRMDRYTKIQADELIKEGYKFNWKDLMSKPLGEFLSRFFANQGYKDGLHGLSLSLLQAFSFLVVYLKVWEVSRFKEQDLSLADFEDEVKVMGRDLNYWINQSKGGSLKKFLKIFKR